jgi:predicted kinase
MRKIDMTKLILMVGLPCSGKTTKAKQLEKEYDLIRFTPDAWQIRLFGQDAEDAEHDHRHSKIEQIMLELAYKLLKKGVSVLLDFGFWAIEERTYLKNKAEELGVGFAICYCECSQDKLIERVQERNKDSENQHFVIPFDMLNRYFTVFEPPTESEGEFM